MILVFAGKEVGTTLLRYLIERGDPVDRVIAASDADREMLSLCRERGLAHDVFHRGLIERLSATGRHYDWILDLWSPHILPKSLLERARQRANLHPSLVPHARGSDSAAWILRRNLPAGVSIVEMTESIDTGAVYSQRKIEVEFPMSGRALHARLQAELIDLFKNVWPQMLSGELRPQPQLSGGSYHRRKQTNEDRVQNESTSMQLGEAITWILAHDFHPGTTAEIVRGDQRFKLRVLIEKVT